MFDLIASLLSFFYNMADSYFVAIGMLTLVVLLVTTPLTLQGTKSMLKMQLLQPEIKAIQSRYGADEREEMNKELLAFYQDNNINPVGGCIPLLVQIPVFLVLYRVILGLTRRATDAGAHIGTVAAQLREGAASFVGFSRPESANFNPAYLNDDTQLYADLTSSNEMEDFGFDLARSASSVLADNFIDSLPYLALVAVVGGSGWIQHRMIRARNTGAVTNPTQEMIMKIMPVFLPVFSFTLPAAIVVYFLVSNLYRIGQQFYITRSMYHGEESLGAQVRKVREDTKDSKDKKGQTKGQASKGQSKGQKSRAQNGKGGAKKGTAAKSAQARANSKKGSQKRSTGSRTSAPGRNTSGRQASARTQVQPRARKKKKR